MKIKITIVAISTFVTMLSFTMSEFKLSYPNYFPEPEYDFSKNSLNSLKIELGRNLFYDPILSSDNSISCATCHSPYNAFSHTDHDVSHGINDQTGTRNAPALFNLAWQKKFMWDGAFNHLDEQAIAPISHPKEMGSTITLVVQKLNESIFYKKLFYTAFKDSIATKERLLQSLAQFQLTLVSANSKYDQVKQGKTVFTDQEQKGYTLFLQYCNACHTEPMFTNYSFAHNGLPMDSTLNDAGKWKITQNPTDSLLFKIPSLRNLSYTYPYMHDGRFKKLQQVLNHYTFGIEAENKKSNELNNPISLSSHDKVDLIAFMLTLDDAEFVLNPKHQYPKKIK